MITLNCDACSKSESLRVNTTKEFETYYTEKIGRCQLCKECNNKLTAKIKRISDKYSKNELKEIVDVETKFIKNIK